MGWEMGCSRVGPCHVLQSRAPGAGMGCAPSRAAAGVLSLHKAYLGLASSDLEHFV